MHLVEQKSPTICREFSRNFMEKSVVGFSSDFHRNGLYYVFQKFSESFQELSDNITKILQEFYCGHTIKLLLTNCSSHTENVRTLVSCTDLI